MITFSVSMGFEGEIEIKPSNYKNWVSGNISRDDLIEVAKENLQIDDIFSDEKIIEWINKNYDPEEIFNDKKLNEWAKENFNV